MALVDVTELLTDPDFVDALTLIARVTTVNSKGENVLSEQSFCSIGSVQPATGKTLQRLPEALRLADVSSFWIKGKVPVDGVDVYPDLIVWKNQRYAVQNIQDFTNWGQGWCEGTCVREKPSL